MRILVADEFPERQLGKLTKRGHDVRHEPKLTADDLASEIGDVEVLVVRSTKVTEAVVSAGGALGVIIRAGAGTNTIDVEAASAKGIFVCNVPGQNAVAVAELTLGLILAIDRRIPDNVEALRRGGWKKTEFSKARGLMGRRVGIVGLGSIGVEVAARARAFGMKVASVRKQGRSEEILERISELGVKLYPDLPAMLGASDIVSLHVPATEGTRGMVDARFLAQMRDGSVLVNTSRGEVIVAEDLLDALETKDMWAGLDVYPDEPSSGATTFQSALATHPRVYGTHHIGASTEQAQNAIAKQVVRIIDRYQEGNVINAVNVAEPMPHTTVVGIRHVDKVGVLSAVFSILRRSELNVEHMENHVFEGARAAKAVIHIQGDLTPEVRRELADLDAVYHVAILRETSSSSSQ